MSKPFSVRELLARVRAQVRRDDWHSVPGEDFSFGDVVVKPQQRLVMRKGRRIALSAREFELLRYLFAHRNEVVSREQLLRDVNGPRKYRPSGGKVGAAASRLRASSTSRNQSGACRPCPIEIRLPTMLRTMWCRKAAPSKSRRQ